jgi:starch synthase (maltosyl-transferring)
MPDFHRGDVVSGSKKKFSYADAEKSPFAEQRSGVAREQKLPESGTAHAQKSPFAVQQALERARVVINEVSPCVEAGRFPAKATVDQPVTIAARIFTDGHNRLAARVLWKEAAESHWHTYPMHLVGNFLWEVAVVPRKMARHHFRIEAWLDPWQNFRHELQQKFQAGVPVAVECEEGRILLREILDFTCDNKRNRASGPGAFMVDPIISHSRIDAAQAVQMLDAALQRLDRARALDDLEGEVHTLLSPTLAEAVAVVEPRRFLTQTRQSYPVDVERTAAGYSAWYELFPRSITDSPQRHGTFDDVIARLPAIQAMGFDVLYFPPIHPIGRKHRKGRNNSVTAGPGEPGSPYAIGAEEGGHDAVHPQLGGIEGFRRLHAAAKNYGLEIALDFAIQCSPDHPWLKTHPDWFSWRPDGTIRYAENPPKKYQDIVNVDFYAENARPPMWLAWRDIILYWISEGVSIFRVDNPHTKPLPFWQWLIADIRSRHPQTIFLSEAFTRTAMMYQLAKIGFTQSYTYFIWRNSKSELSDYMTELSTPPVRDFYRPHFFVNTPDINPYFTQHSGRAGFLIRSALAATLSGLWGVYSGFEYCEAAALPGREEYLDSEKYEIKPRDFSAPGNIIAEISRLNQIRKENPALHTHLNVKFYESHNDQVIFYGKATLDRSNIILVAVSLDPHRGQDAQLRLPLHEWEGQETWEVTELMRDLHFQWRGEYQHWYFDPGEIPFAIWRLRPLTAAVVTG